MTKIFALNTKNISITCNGFSSCQTSSFHINNNELTTIKCLENIACYQTKIYNSNVTYFDAIFDNGGFSGSYLVSDSSNNEINVYCGTFSCRSSSFIYNVKQMATHICEARDSCSEALIYSQSPISLYCNAHAEYTGGYYSYPCGSMQAIWPSDITKMNESSLIISGSDGDNYKDGFVYEIFTVNIFTPNGITPTIICKDDCSYLDDIFIIYGIQFDEYCQANNVPCMDYMDTIGYTDYLIIETFDNNNHSSGFDFSIYPKNQNILLILADENAGGEDVENLVPFIPPVMNRDTLWLSIICIWCHYINFDFSQIQNVAMTNPHCLFISEIRVYKTDTYSGYIIYYENGLYGSTIISPLNTFKSNVYMFDYQTTKHWLTDNYNKYIITNTINVIFNGIALSTVHSSNQTNIDFNCGNTSSTDIIYGCTFVDIYSDIDPKTITLLESGFNVNCGICNGFDIIFSSLNDTKCVFTSNGIDPTCDFLSISPTNSPSNSPTTPPSAQPSNAPTNTPSIAPTTAPSNNPSSVPTFPPSSAPSIAPSSSPTRWPTEVDQYSKKKYIDYIISNLTTLNKDGLLNVEYINIINIIERGYVNMAQIYIDQTGNLEYQQFQIVINTNNWEKDSTDDEYHILTMETSMKYSESEVLRSIEFISGRNDFIVYVKNDLKKYFDNTVQFAISYPLEEELSSFDYVFYSLLSFMFIMAIVSFAAWIYNKKGSTIDDSQWTSLMIFGLQIFDFVSDINLCIEILLKFEKAFELSLLYIAGYGSLIFIIIPYIINIIIASNIKKIVSGNNAAMTYFEQRSNLFVILVLLSSSSYQSLQLLSSRLFAADIFNSGLTKYELRQLLKLKVGGNIISENLPQLICQLMYLSYSGVPSQNTLLALISSFLSIFGAILSYLITNRSSGCIISQYDLKLIKSNLNDKEKKQIFARKELKKGLRKLLCAALNVEDNNIELGYLTVISNGFIINVIHYTFKDELNAFGNSDLFVEKLYKIRENEVKFAFKQHFNFDDNRFKVIYFKKYGYNLFKKQSSNMEIELAQSMEDYEEHKTDIDDIDDDKYDDSLSAEFIAFDSAINKISNGLRQNKEENNIKKELIDDGYTKEQANNLMFLFQSNDD